MRWSDRLAVPAGSAPDLAHRDAGDRMGLVDKESAGDLRLALAEQLRLWQNRLWAEAERSVLLVLQGMDASGKDGTIRRVFTGVNPQGCRVVGFKPPVGVEREHDYLWRVHANCPRRGEIGIFNRSHYEDVVAVRVRGLHPEPVWKRRQQHIVEFERMLTDEGTAIVKVFLHVSKEEQGDRLETRRTDPEKHWKWHPSDLDDRALWDGYMEAWEEVVAVTSTDHAPWYVVPADRKWVRDVAVTALLVEVLADLAPEVPPSPELLAELPELP